ncbi:MAG: RNA polymerase sigma factor region1.1 domain-containing protein [bacterium]
MSHETSQWLQELRNLGREQGFLTHSQINSNPPPSVVDPEEISMIVNELESLGIQIVETAPRPEE